MTRDEAMGALEACGSEQTRKTYRNHGVGGDLFGVKYADLGALRKRIKTDDALAGALWATGNHDARVLATMIADPAALTAARIDAWAADVSDPVLADALASLVARAPTLARAWAGAHRDDPAEWPATLAWKLYARLADGGGDPPPPDADLLPLLAIIRAEIHGRPNRVREAMNGALIAIGCRNDVCEAAALEVAAAVGKVAVDHGTTACKTPDAVAYIRKTRAHRGGSTG